MEAWVESSLEIWNQLPVDAALGTLTAAGDGLQPRHVLRLSESLWSGDAISGAVEAALDGSMRRWSPKALYWLDGRLGRGADGEARLTVADVVRLDRRPRALAALGLASMDGSGWVRAAAVEALARRDEALAFRFLLVRVSDWVLPVAHAAAVALARAPLARWAEELWFAREVQRRARSERRGFGVNLDARLATPEGRVALEQVIGQARPGSLGAAFEALARLHPAALPSMIAGALRAADQRVVAHAARAMSVLAPAEALVIARDAVRARVTPVRLLGWRELSRLDAAPDADVILRGLLDRNAEIGGLARFYARATGAAGPAGPVAWYRARFDAGGADAGQALVGLDEAGNQDDIARFEAALASATPSWRRRGLSGLARVAPARARAALRRALGDPNTSVVREALARLDALGVDADDRQAAEAIVLDASAAAAARDVLRRWLQRRPRHRR